MSASRLAIHAVAVTGLGALGIALGRWLRDPAVDGSLLALMLMTAVCALALRRLYGTGGLVALRAPEQPAQAPRAGRDRPPAPEPGPLWAGEEPSAIDLNTATEAELLTLPGVGPVLAARIAGARPFESVDGLATVPGFSPARLRAIRDRVRV